MIYKILVTTIVTRGEAVSVKTDVVEFYDYSEASRAIERLNDDRSSYSVGLTTVNLNRKAIAINFSYDG